MAAGIRLTNGAEGCSPTADPKTPYTNPFRVDADGALWIDECFHSLLYFGAARQDVVQAHPLVIGSKGCPVAKKDDVATGKNVITAGRFRNVTIHNTTDCTLGVLLGIDSMFDITNKQNNLVHGVISAKWNGQRYSTAEASTYQQTATARLCRQEQFATVNPHDLGIEANGVPTLKVLSGKTATVSVSLQISYLRGAATGVDVLNRAQSAVRVYGYIM